MTDVSVIRAFYSGKSLFVTGGTGFVGLALIERILRSIPDVDRIYMLMRPKKDKSISERLEEFTKNSIFEKLLETTSKEIFKKLVPIAGDVGEEGLGISFGDRQKLIDNVHVVIHSAATLDFQENLRPTTNINILGTRRVMELCQEIKDLRAAVHVSSAYVSSYMTEAKEEVYDAPGKVEDVISMVKSLSDTALEEVESKIIGKHPNTYTFTKHLAEHEILKHVKKFPCAIVRPTMIIGAWKEPIPGWTCSKVGPQGFLMGAAKGVIRRLPICKELVADYIPVDVVVNQLLVAGYNAAKTSRGVTVFHCSSSTSNPFKWQMMETQVNQFLHKNPLQSAVWYPHLKFVSSLWLFKLSAIFVHFLPALILDNILRLSGKRPILVRMHKNVWNSLNRLKPFIFGQWKFHNDNTKGLIASQTDSDRKTFYIDISELSWINYFEVLSMGVRTYLNKEKPRSIPAARKKQNILLAVHVLWHTILFTTFWYIGASVLDSTMSKTAGLVPLFYFFYSLI